MKKLELNKKLGIKIMTGTLSAVILGTSLFAVCANAKNDTTNDKVKCETAVNDDEDDGTLEDTLDKNMYISTVDADKEETVYVIADASGSANQVIVSEHLLNKNKDDVIKDTSSLQNITNVKGDESFTRDGDAIEWNADGNEIYYQGTTDKEIPIVQSIHYYLDGKEMAPSDMAGVSGRVTIRFEYENNAVYDDVTVPFVAFTALAFDDSFSHISVSSGKIVEDGNRSVVIGYALPGMKDSLNAKNANIPDSFEVSADVENFSLEATMTMVANLGSISLEGSSIDATSLDDTVQAILTGVNELSTGAEKLADGADTLKISFGDYKKGVKTLTDGMKQYVEGVTSLHAGIGQVKAGMDSVSANMPTMKDGITSLMNGANDAYQGSVKLVDGMAQLRDGINKLTGKVENMAGDIDKAKEDVCKQFEQTAGMSIDQAKQIVGLLKSYRDEVIDGMVAGTYPFGISTSVPSSLSLPAGIPDAGTGKAVLSGINDKLSSLEGGLAKVDGATSALDGVKGKVTGSDTSEGIGALKTGVGKVETGIIALNGGLWTLYDGTRKLNDGSTALVNGIGQLSEGVNQLYAGSQTLVSNNETLLGGADKIENATDQVYDGIVLLSDGAGQLNDGITSFREEGVNKFAGGEVTDAKGFVEKLDKVEEAAKDYQSFAGINEDQQGTVRFIIRTAGIK